MPVRNDLLTEMRARLAALREAARVGIADSQAGRVKAFDSETQLRGHLDALLASQIGPVKARRKN